MNTLGVFYDYKITYQVKNDACAFMIRCKNSSSGVNCALLLQNCLGIYIIPQVENSTPHSVRQVIFKTPVHQKYCIK